MMLPAHTVEVDLSGVTALAQANCHNYAVLFDPEIAQVEAIALALPTTFIFVFITKMTEANYEDLPKSHYIVKPFSLLGFDPSTWANVANSIVVKTLIEN